ncbi:ML domain-containing protein [Diaporthe sp. PMI_573]|nr:ML domain-containing protein [Diaporthaceae sp. PMI_573]
MKLKTFMIIFSAATASSRTVIVPDSGHDAWSISIADTAMPPPGPRIPGQNTLNLCKGDHSHDAVVIDQVDFIPNPPKKGNSLTVAAAGTVTESVVPGAVVEVKVKFIGTQVYHQKFDICGELGKMGQSCPLAPGQYSFNKTFDVPEKVPHGNYQLYAVAKLPNGHPITCIDGKIKVDHSIRSD